MKYLITVLALVATQASAQSQKCAPRDVMIDQLTGKYAEKLQGHGLGSETAFVEFWANRESGSWSVTVTNPAGISCLVASGRHYEAVNQDEKT